MNKLLSKSIITLITFIVALSLLATTVTISPEIFAQTNLSSMQPSANISQDSTGPPPSSIQLPTTQQQVDAVATSQPCLETKADRTPQQTEGPYFVDEMLNRSDIRSDPSDGSVQDGIPLRLIIHIHDFGRNGSCTPLKGAHVDIWHANSQGLYSDIQQAGTEGKKYLRGFQVTDDNGTVNLPQYIQAGTREEQYIYTSKFVHWKDLKSLSTGLHSYTSTTLLQMRCTHKTLIVTMGFQIRETVRTVSTLDHH